MLEHISKNPIATLNLLLAVSLTCQADAWAKTESEAARGNRRRPSPPAKRVFPRPAPLPEGPVAALREFEQRAIPEPPRGRAGVVVPLPDAGANKRAQKRARPSALYPPAPLSTTIRATARAPQPAGPDTTLQGWQTELRLPDLPVRWSKKLLSYLRFYRDHPKGRAIMALWMKRMGRYERMIRREIQLKGLPQALVFVAMIESGFDPLQTSPVGAAGLWQFMVGTGRDYGLDRDHWIDERRNPELATRAALRFLKNLYERLGSWELALAAYNSGFGTVIEAMRKYNTNDYWRLCRYEAGLPWSTTLYVPKILAAALVASNRSAFGYDSVVADPPLEHELVAVTVSATLKQLADAAGADLERMLELNPELRRGRTPPYPRVWVRVPPGTRHRFYAFLEPLRRTRHRPYVVKLGDTDRSIAESHGITTRQLRRLNKLRSATELRPGLTIFVPAKKASASRTGSSAPSAVSAKRTPGADPEEKHPVLVPLPAEAPTRVDGRPQRVFYRVVLGDSLARIARHLSCSPTKLAEWNALNPSARLVSKMVLQAFLPAGQTPTGVSLLDPRRIKLITAGSEEFLDLYERRKGRRRLTYTVRPGDTLRRIARRFGLSVGSLLRINRFGRGTRLRPGDKVVVYTDKRTPGKRQRKRRRGRSRA